MRVHHQTTQVYLYYRTLDKQFFLYIYLLNEKLVDPETASISPYWRRNHTDEDWRKVKKEWLADQENDF